MSKTAKKGRRSRATPRKAKPRTVPTTPYDFGVFMDRLAADHYEEGHEGDAMAAKLKKAFRDAYPKATAEMFEGKTILCVKECGSLGNRLGDAQAVWDREIPGLESFRVSLQLEDGALDPLQPADIVFVLGGPGSALAFARRILALGQWLALPEFLRKPPETRDDGGSRLGDELVKTIFGA